MFVQEEGCDAKLDLNLCNLHLQFCLINSPYGIAMTKLYPFWSTDK